MNLDELGEQALVKLLARKFSTAHPRIIKAIGDDTSVSTQKGGMALLATTDTLTEGVHFERRLTTPSFLGSKALSVSLSDIASMGGAPLFFLVSLSIPPGTEKKFIEKLYTGMLARAKGPGCALAGGNVSRSRELSITTTVLGEAGKSDIVYRKGARPGDIIYITGTPGDSALGLLELKRKGLARALKGPFREQVRRHLDPAPRLEAGSSLARGRLATSMIDVSDGLALDLERLCAESKTGAVIEIQRLPLSGGLDGYRRRGGDWASLALSGGEDYELMFTAPAAKAAAIERLSGRLGLPMTAIGRITGGKGLRILGPDNRAVKLEKTGFLHF